MPPGDLPIPMPQPRPQPSPGGHRYPLQVACLELAVRSFGVPEKGNVENPEAVTKLILDRAQAFVNYATSYGSPSARLEQREKLAQPVREEPV